MRHCIYLRVKRGQHSKLFNGGAGSLYKKTPHNMIEIERKFRITKEQKNNILSDLEE